MARPSTMRMTTTRYWSIGRAIMSTPGAGDTHTTTGCARRIRAAQESAANRVAEVAKARHPEPPYRAAGFAALRRSAWRRTWNRDAVVKVSSSRGCHDAGPARAARWPPVSPNARPPRCIRRSCRSPSTPRGFCWSPKNTSSRPSPDMISTSCAHWCHMCGHVGDDFTRLRIASLPRRRLFSSAERGITIGVIEGG
jgi:hypothetical protein